MGDVKLTLNMPVLKQPDDDASERVGKAVKAKKVATESLDDAWIRILAMKNSEADTERLHEVKRAMAEGSIGRTPSAASKRFSKAEALRMWAELNENRREETLRKMVENTPENYRLVRNNDDLAFMIVEIKSSDIIAVDCETFGEKSDDALDPWEGKMAGFSVSSRHHHFYVPLNHVEQTELTESEIVQAIKGPLEHASIVMHNAPFDCKWFYVKYGINLIDALYADTRIMAMAFDENRTHRLKDLCADWLKMPGDNFDQLFGRTPFNQVPLDVALVYAAGDTDKTLKLYDWIAGWYDKREDLRTIKRLVFEMEMPVARQFIRSDIRGIRFDVETAKELDGKFAEEIAGMQAEIYELLGEEINLNSPTQLSKKLYVDLKLPDNDKGSTGVRSLKRVKKLHPVISKILAFREVEKLRQSFTAKLPNDVKYDGKIHPWHNTYGAATGRFTCNNPNTQQIPAKRPEIRELFTATSDDRILVSIDYSQIELRVLAHYAKDPVLIEAFEQGRDIHSTTAAQVFGCTYEQIEAMKDVDGSKEQKYRKQSKIVNFGIVYGMGAGKLADTLEISKKEAQEIIDGYFRAYPGIKRFMDEQHASVMKNGFVMDLFGRKRRLHNEIKSKDQWKVFSAQRMAGNFPIQSTAGGIFKKAIVNLQPILSKLNVDILLQVHDEGVFDCPADIKREDLYLIRSTMENAVKLDVPIRCDLEIYDGRWMRKVSEDKWFSEE